MRKRMMLTVILVLFAGSALIFATGGQTEGGTAAAGEVNPGGVFPIVEEPLTLTVYREANLTAEQVEALAENEVLNYHFEKTNIKLDFIHLNPAEGKTKMILSFAADDYPDAAFLSWNTMFSRDDIMQYGIKEKYLLPLNDYIDNYGVEIKKIFAVRPNHRALLTAPDGNIYGVPRFTECFHCMSYPKLWFNYGWLEKLGLDEPRTTDEFYEVLKAFKTQDPNGNGIADEVPATGNVEWSCALEYWLMNSFIDTPAASTATNPRPFLSWIDNKVTFVAGEPAYREGIEWMKMLYDEGLIDPGNFTQNVEGMRQLIRSEPTPVGAYTVDHVGMGIDFGNKEELKNWKALPPLAGPRGVQYQPLWDAVSQLSGFSFAIFDKAENPEAAYRYADYLLSEDNMWINTRGTEGIGWERAPAGAKNIEGGPFVRQNLPGPADDAPQSEVDEWNRNRFSFGLMGDLRERRAMWTPEAVEGDESYLNQYEVYLHIETMKTEPYWPDVSLPRLLFMEKETAEEFAELKTNIVSHVIKNTGLFITGARDLDDWDSYLSELKRFGVDRYVEIYTEAYNQFNAAMK